MTTLPAPTTVRDPIVTLSRLIAPEPYFHTSALIVTEALTLLLQCRRAIH